MHEPNDRPRVLIADDHAIVAQGLAALLEPDFQLVGVAENGAQAVEMAAELSPDLVVMDLSMPVLGGIDATRRMTGAAPKTAVILLSMHTDPTYVREALNAGARGYVLKQMAASELKIAIHKVLEGAVHVSTLPDRNEDLRNLSGTDIHPGLLTERQRTVLKLVAEGCSAKDIANTLGISVKTAEFHKAGIMQKLGVKGAAQLTKYAIEHGILH